MFIYSNKFENKLLENYSAVTHLIFHYSVSIDKSVLLVKNEFINVSPNRYSIFVPMLQRQFPAEIIKMTRNNR